MANDLKRCTKCGEPKALDEFGRDKRAPSGLGPRCLARRRLEANANYARRAAAGADLRAWAKQNPELVREYRRAWREKNRDAVLLQKRATYFADPIFHRRGIVLRKYGLTLEQYDQMVLDQDDRCAICATTDKGRDRQHWSIDHCHATNKVRGLLCHTCNLGIGHLGDDAERVYAAAVYLRDHSRQSRAA